MDANEWVLLPFEVQDATDLPPVDFDGIWPAMGSSPEQAQFTVHDRQTPAHGAAFHVPMRGLTPLAIRVAYEGVQKRFAQDDYFLGMEFSQPPSEVAA